MRLARTLALALVCPIALAAQSERITIRLAPNPNQNLRARMTQEATMDVEPAGGSSGASIAIPAMKLGLTTSMTTSMALGVPDDRGHIEARTTYDDIKMEVTLNGSPTPMPNSLASLGSRVFTITYDADGRMLDMTSDAPDALLTALKPMMSNLFGATAPVTLAIGESVARPINFTLPIPAPAGGGGIAAETKYTLSSVTSEGGDRIAHLALATTGQMQQTLQGGAAALEMTLNGEGTMEVNVDRGFTRVAEQRLTLDASLGGVATAPAMRMHGTVKISQTTEPY